MQRPRGRSGAGYHRATRRSPVTVTVTVVRRTHIDNGRSALARALVDARRQASPRHVEVRLRSPPRADLWLLGLRRVDHADRDDQHPARHAPRHQPPGRGSTAGHAYVLQRRRWQRHASSVSRSGERASRSSQLRWRDDTASDAAMLRKAPRPGAVVTLGALVPRGVTAPEIGSRFRPRDRNG